MVIVYPSNVIDVVNAVNWGRKQGLNIRCRSGGHNYESFSVGDDVVVIDVSNLLNFEIDTIEIGFLLLGGKIAENEHLSSAYPHRGSKVLIQIDAEWNLEYSIYADVTIKWVNNLRKSLLPYAGFGYLNYCDINIPNYLYNYFGNNVAWLKTVKEKYDPYNLFYYPQGINL